MFSAANGVGKTTGMVSMMANMFWPNENPYFQQKLFTDFPYKYKKGRIVSDPTTIKSTIVPMLQEIFPKGRYKVKKGGKQYESIWKIDTGWEFDIMTYEQSPKEFESANLSFTFFDEPPPLAIYKATVARMRTGGFIAIFATPLSGSAWMYDEIVHNPDIEKEYRCFVEAEVEDACIIHGVRGFLEHENIVKMIAQYDDEDMQARVFGKFQHLTGLVFKSYKPEIHIIDRFEVNPQDFMVVQAYDTHPRVNEAVTWVAWDRQMNCYVIDELWSDVETSELVAQIQQKDDRYRMIDHLLDPSAFNVDKRTGGSYAAELQSKGLNYRPGSKRREDARKLISDRLSYRVAGGKFVKPPTIFIFNDCTQTQYELSHWQWDDWVGKAAERKDPKATPQDKNDHFIENIGRILLAVPPAFQEYTPPKRGAVANAIEDDPF